MKKKAMAGMMIGCMAASLCAGCSKAKSTDSDSSDKVVTVNFSNFFIEDQAYHDGTHKAVDKFNAENKNAQIVLEEMPSDAYITKTNSLGTADGLADICMVNGTMLQAFSESEVIIPLTDLIKEYKVDKNMKTGIFDECTSMKDGEIYSIPIAAGTYGFILYNEDIFNKVGIKEFPKTLDEFEDACAKLKDAGYIPMALGDKALWPADSLMFSSFVNNFVGNEWFNDIRKHNGKANFTDQVFIDALTAFAHLAEIGCFNEDFSSIDNDERQALYSNGKAAMISAGDWECININDNSPDVAKVTKAAAWPAPSKNAKADGSIEQSAAWGFALGANITEEEKEVAMKFLSEYLITEEFGRDLVEVQNAFPAWNVTYDKTKLTSAAASVQEAVENNTPCLNWDSSLDATVKEVYQRDLQELLMGSMSPEEMAKDMQTEYEAVE